jgi:alkanesulfonate monooxygenase SsuD/methylene tetrahydromethanopterin reductase-like flavin-dependent oxidoreductase (luciferase family)
VQVAGRKGWGVVSSQLISIEGLANHWQMFRKGRQEAGRVADSSDWRICRSIFIAATDEEARARAFSAESGYRHFFGHMHKVYTQIGRLGVLKTQPDMRDDEVTVDTFIEQRLIYGSPKTVLASLIKLRQQVGPFGSLLLTAVDWAGPNAAWERESLTRLVEEVMPAFREHAAAAA